MFALEKVLFAKNLDEIKWTFAIIFMGGERVQYYDSMGSDGRVYRTGIMRYLKDERAAKIKVSYQKQTDERLLVLWTVCCSIK